MIVWFDEREEPRSFRLCYDKRGRERALSWHAGKLSHAIVDSAKNRDALAVKPIDVLVSELEFDTTEILTHFEAIRGQLPLHVAKLIDDTLRPRTEGVPLPAADGPLN